MKKEYTRLVVRDLRCDMHIGIFEEDKKLLHPLLVNLEADVLLPPNWQADDYGDVLGYDKLVFMIREMCGNGHINLVETLTEKIADRCFEWPQVMAVKVRIEKPKIFDDCIPGVEIVRKRAGWLQPARAAAKSLAYLFQRVNSYGRSRKSQKHASHTFKATPL